MQRSSVAVMNLHRNIAYPLRIAESLSWHSRYASIVQTKVKMWVLYTLKKKNYGEISVYKLFITYHQCIFMRSYFIKRRSYEKMKTYV